MRDLFIETLLKRARNNKRIFLITADLGFKVFDQYRSELPDQFLNIGIAEQNMIGVATGLALSGRTVFVYSIANFPSLRCLEQIRNDACYHEANVKIVSVGSGLSYGQLGSSHHATEDISIMRSLPNITVLSPGDDQEVVACTNYAVDMPGTCYLRLDREGFCSSNSSEELVIRSDIRTLRQGQSIALLSTGGMLKVSIEVAEKLSAQGIQATIATLPKLSQVNELSLQRLAKDHLHLFTLEEHSIHGGLGGLVAETLLEMGPPHPLFYRFGLRSGFSSVVGDQNYLRRIYGLDSNSIVEKISSILSLGSQN